MSKKKGLLFVLALICIVLAVLFATNYYNTGQKTEENQPQNNPPQEPQLVIPESPLGTLGLISALATGFGAFIIMKKRI